MTEDVKIIRGNEIQNVTPKTVAEMFCNLDSHDQALFFNNVHAIASEWDGMGFDMQLQYITEDVLTMGGRRVMQQIGEYSHWGLTCNDIREAAGGKT